MCKYNLLSLVYYYLWCKAGLQCGGWNSSEELMRMSPHLKKGEMAWTGGLRFDTCCLSLWTPGAGWWWQGDKTMTAWRALAEFMQPPRWCITSVLQHINIAAAHAGCVGVCVCVFKYELMFYWLCHVENSPSQFSRLYLWIFNDT